MALLQRPVQILLIEDSPGDVWLTREILMQGPVPKEVHVVTNGELAIRYLRRRGEFSSATRPDLVLLDLNLPRRNGFEVLREIKSDPSLRSITVVVLTTSESESDVNAAYDLNANCYVVKPVDLEQFTTAIQGIEEFWLRMAMLPHPSRTVDDREGNGSANASSTGPNAAVAEDESALMEQPVCARWPACRCERSPGLRFRERRFRRAEARECRQRGVRFARRAPRARRCIAPSSAASALAS
jgi:two-component system, chemotaxis family, response regulator Rcp1